MHGFYESISGVIENVVYRNDDNDYSVIEIVDKENNLITCVGNMPLPFEGENVVLTGSWTFHKEFGKQFAFDSFEKTLPEEEEGILQYLSSKTVKGIGPVTALKIVNRFGKDTFDVIENHPEWLVDIQGITMKKAATISESFKEQTGLRNVMMFCKEYMDKGEVTRVYKRFGSAAVDMIKENPYILCDEHYGIPFEKADRIARDFGVSPTSYARVLAGVIYTLIYNAENNGHTCLPYEKLSAAAAVTLGIGEKDVADLISQFVSDAELSAYTVEQTVYIMKNDVDEAEKYIAKRISDMESYANHFGVGDIHTMINSVEDKLSIEYAAQQKEAIFKALSGSIMILTGGPGTGKTTVVKGLLSIFDSIGHKCVLAAPTGRAAKRLSEATSHEAKTIHRLLEMERREDGAPRFNRDAQRPIDENVIIIDEASMIDLSLMFALFRAIKRGARLILIGDTDQLPSVGAGNVLSDLISTNKVTTVLLTEIFRQSEESLIITNAHRINNGADPILNDTKRDFFFVRRDNEQDIPLAVAALITERLPRTYGKSIRDEIQVISPSKKGNGGVALLNPHLQACLNPPAKFKKEITLHSVCFREGDKVMQTTNNYEIEWDRNGVYGTGVFNGDIGYIEQIDTVNEKIYIRFDDRRATYTFDISDELDLAYAITVHKSQGSEYPVVIIPCYRCPSVLMTRNLLYTAVTRARRMVIMVGRADIPSQMVANNIEVMRYTTLAARITSII